MGTVLCKAAGSWLLIMLLAVANGLLRESLLTTLLGAALALPVSGLLLSLLVFLVAYLIIPYIGPHPAAVWLAMGLFWVVLTLLFEFTLAHVVMGRPWEELGHEFDPRSGNLFLLALFSAALSPLIAAGLRGQLHNGN